MMWHFILHSSLNVKTFNRHVAVCILSYRKMSKVSYRVSSKIYEFIQQHKRRVGYNEFPSSINTNQNTIETKEMQYLVNKSNVKIKEILELYSPTELMKVLTSYTNGESRIIKGVEKTCCCRCHDWNTTQRLNLAVAFFKLHYIPILYIDELLHYITEEILVDSTSLSSGQILEVLFFCSLNIHRSSDVLMHCMEQQVLQHIGSFSVNDLGVVAHTMFSSNHSIRSIDLLEQFAQTLISYIDNIDFDMMENILKSLNHGGYFKLSFYGELADKLCIRVPSVGNPYTLIRMVKALSSRNYYHKHLMTLCIDKYLEMFKVENFRIKDVARILNAVSHLDHTCTPNQIDQFVSIVEDYIQCGNCEQWPEEMVDIVASMLTMDTATESMLQAVTDRKFVKKLSKSPGKDKGNRMLLIDRCLAFNSTHFEDRSLRVPEAYLATLPANVFAQSHFEAKRTGLPHLVQYLTSMYGHRAVKWHAILDHFKTMDIEIRLDEDNQPIEFNDEKSPYTKFQRTRDISQDTMKNIVASVENSITFKLQSEMEQENAKQNDEKACHLDGRILEPIDTIDNKCRRVAVVLLGFNQCCSNNSRRLLGMTKLKLKHLRMAGYHVLIVSPKQCTLIDTDSISEQRTHIRNFILKPLGLK
ncbi:unnamed protein product [Owenia fusiformis]|uniref:Uncharacterized protein n=1 Tax=Owenia fusiformis TaxID=6347 RepID=A0A8J1TWV5_OWEFU|nr:unnamed protein product [Owenia fusiformis]